MIPKAIFLAAGNDSFWKYTEPQMHTMLLREGVCIGMPTKEVYDLIDQAKAMFFCASSSKMPKYTDCSVVNIIIHQQRGLHVATVFE